MNWFVATVIALGVSMTGDMVTSCAVPRHLTYETDPLYGRNPSCRRYVLEMGAIDTGIVAGTWRLRRHGGRLGRLWPAGIMTETVGHIDGIVGNAPLIGLCVCPAQGSGCR